jgi:hypothetical protein
MKEINDYLVGLGFLPAWKSYHRNHINVHVSEFGTVVDAISEAKL